MNIIVEPWSIVVGEIIDRAEAVVIRVRNRNVIASFFMCLIGKLD